MSHMGEAKRRRAYDTLDGGPPSDDRIVLEVEIFDPLQAMLALDDDALRRTAIRECAKRAYQRPTPICVACDYEFGCGEPPTALYCTRPMFPKGEAFTFVCGAICPRCASQRPDDELAAAIVGYLRTAKPDLTIVEAGTA
jgi:hypothetical protein